MRFFLGMLRLPLIQAGSVFFSGDLTWQQWPDWIAGPRLPRLRGFARVHRFVSLRCPWLTETVQRTLRSQLEHLEVAQRIPETCT